MSRKSPDIRKPCSGDAKPILFAGCGPNQRKKSLQGIQVLTNTTQQLDYASPQYVSPFRSPEQETAPDCSEFQAPSYICNDGNGNGYPWCGQPDPELYKYTGTVFRVGSKYFNSYLTSSDTISFSECEAIGSKRVYAKKAWQGRWSYNSRMLGAVDEMDWCSNCQIHYEDASADQTKYLSIAAQVSIHKHTDVYQSDGGSVNGQVCCPRDGGGEDCIDNACVTYTFDHSTDYKGSASNTTHCDVFGNFYVDSASSGSSISDSALEPEDVEALRVQYANDAWGLLAKANDDVNILISIWSDERTGLPDPDRITGEGSHWRLEYDSTYDTSDECGNTTTHTFTTKALEIDLAAGTLDVWGYSTRPTPAHSHCTGDGQHYSVYQSRHEHYSFSGTSMLWTAEGENHGSISFDEVHSTTVTGKLSSPYHASTVQETMRNLLGVYPLDDDSLLPWRTELDLIGPLVSYHEGQMAPFVMAESGSRPYTGRLMGRPAPAGISPGVWNQEAKNFDWCISNNGFEDCYIKFLSTWGQWSHTVGIPSATQWLDKWTACQMPQGAFVGLNFFYTAPSTCNETGPVIQQADEVWGCKMAEVIQQNRRSFNHSRPCGVDRFAIKEGSSRCITSVTDNILALEPNASATDIETGDLVWVCGTNSVDGLWTATKDGDFEITLNGCLATASVYPSGPLPDCGEGMIAKLRWQLLRPGICGRVDIASVTGTPITCSLKEPQYLITGDQIIVTGAEGGGVNGLWTVTVIDASTIVLDGSSASDGPYKANTGQAYCPGAPDWRWNDSEPKNEFHRVEWFMNYRDIGEFHRIAERNSDLPLENACDGLSTCPTQEQPSEPRAAQAALGLAQEVYSMISETGCAASSPCRPSVVFWSPNGETFSKNPNIQNATNFGFPSVTVDSQYGGIMWNAIVRQTDNDYLWQAPPCPCSQDDDGHYGCNRDILDLPWTEDEGTCYNGGYARAPQVEARSEPVEGSPVLPSGVYLGCLTPADIAAGKTQGRIFNPPAHDPNAHIDSEERAYEPLISYEPYYALYAREKECVCTGGTFSDTYSKDGVTCNTVAPPF